MTAVPTKPFHRLSLTFLLVMSSRSVSPVLFQPMQPSPPDTQAGPEIPHGLRQRLPVFMPLEVIVKVPVVWFGFPVGVF